MKVNRLEEPAPVAKIASFTTRTGPKGKEGFATGNGIKKRGQSSARSVTVPGQSKNRPRANGIGIGNYFVTRGHHMRF